MKVKLIVSRAGPLGVQNAGEVIDIDVDEAQRMIDAGQAEIIRQKAPEKAVKRSKAERAAK